MSELDEVRAHHLAAGLTRDHLLDDPVAQYRQWLAHATEVGVHQPDAAVVATVDAEGRPGARFVLVRGIDADGLTFYTNHDSPKGRALDATGVAALTVGWLVIGRQVRVEGTVERVGAEASDAYWATRPRGSQLAARASAQSRPIEDRGVLEQAYAEESARWDGREVPRPEGWGGYRVGPGRWEFWQGRPDRLHDRFAYLPDRGGGWAISRLSP